MKNFIKTFGFFFKKYPRETLLVIALLVMSGVFEALGIMVFFPFLQIFLDGKDTIDNFPVPFIDGLLKQYNIAVTFKLTASFIIATMTAKAFILMLAIYKVSDIVARIGDDFRKSYFSSLLSVEWDFLTKHSMGESMNSISTENIRSSQTFVSISRLIAKSVQASVYITSAFILSSTTCLLILGAGLITAIILKILIKVARVAGTHQTETFKGMMGAMADIIQGIKPLRVMGIKKKFLTSLFENSDDLKNAHKWQLIATQALPVLQEPLMVIAAISGIYLSLQYSDLQGSEILLIMVFFIRIMTALNNMQSEFQKLVRDESAFWSHINLIDTVTKNTEEDQGTLSLPTKIKSVTFDHVKAQYKTKQVFHDAHILLEAGTFTIISGESGTGKSTILDLLSRLHNPAQGRIFINGNIDLRDIQLSTWRQKIGFVPQDVTLFNDTIFNNIVLGRDHLSENDVWKALENANALSFIEKLELGIHAPVGESGRLISGGQKQRLAIASAIVDNPDILILDEVTSALDTQTEESLLTTFKQLAQDRIIIMSSHSATAFKFADRIYKIKNNEIIKEK